MFKNYTKLLITFFICVFVLPIFSKDFNESEIENNLSKMMGTNNVGKEFYFTFIPCGESSGENNNLEIFVTSDVETRVVVSVPGKGYSKVKKIKPNIVTQFSFSPSIGQAYRRSELDHPLPDQVWQGAGVRVVADDPIICYAMTAFKYTSDSFLALPVSGLGKDYIIASFRNFSNSVHQNFPSYSGIVAAYDNTQVRFTMGGNDWSKTAGGTLPGETSVWNMNEGDVLLIAGDGPHADITGSTVHATKPVAVVSGNYCAFVPTNVGCCDVLEEMELPTKTWGKEYHISNIIHRKKNSIIKIFAKENKTIIYKDYLQMGYIKTAGGTEGTGFLSIRAENGMPRPVVISGDKPISVTQYNPGQADDGVSSDPFQMAITPVEQYQKEIMFNTPGIRGYNEINVNYINIIYQSTEKGTIPDNLELGIEENGIFHWKKLKDLSADPGIPFVVNPKKGIKYFEKTLLFPKLGVYKLKSNKPLAAYIYGSSDYESYGCPSFVGLKDLEKRDSLPPKPEWEISDGNVNIGKPVYVTDQCADPKQISNLNSIYMDSDSSYNYQLYYSSFIPCEDASASWRLKLIDTQEDARAFITFRDCADNDTTTVIKYNAVKLKINTNNYDFGLISIGDTVERRFYVINYSETSEAELNILKLFKNDINDPQGFSIWNENGKEKLQMPQTILPMDSIAFRIKFIASKTGIFSDSIGMGNPSYFSYYTGLKVEVGAPIIQVSDYDFLPIPLGASSVGEFDITNSGNQNLKIFGYKEPTLKGNDKDGKEYIIFKIQGIDKLKIDSTNFLLLKPNETKTFQVRFKPDKVKHYIDSIVILSNSYNLLKGRYCDNKCIFTSSAYPNTSVRDDYLLKTIKISPNPADNKLHISNSDEKIILKEIKITDINGNLLIGKKINTNALSLDISGLSNGIYFLNVATNKGIIKHKFIIRH